MSRIILGLLILSFLFYLGYGRIFPSPAGAFFPGNAAQKQPPRSQFPIRLLRILNFAPAAVRYFSRLFRGKGRQGDLNKMPGSGFRACPGETRRTPERWKVPGGREFLNSPRAAPKKSAAPMGRRRILFAVSDLRGNGYLDARERNSIYL